MILHLRPPLVRTALVRTPLVRTRGRSRSFALLLPMLCLLPLYAQALRCPDGLVALGDHKVEVLDACGEPLLQDRVFENPVRVLELGGERVVQTLGIGIPVDEWVYEFSPQRFRQLLRFRNNRLVAVEALDKPG